MSDSGSEESEKEEAPEANFDDTLDEQLMDRALAEVLLNADWWRIAFHTKARRPLRPKAAILPTVCAG